LKAILLAAGYGTRLKPLTNTIPKCLVQIHDRPLLDYWFESLNKTGINDILINTHYLSSKVEDFIIQNNYKCTIKYEKELLGTAGTLINNLDFIGLNECLLIHADNFSLIDLNALINAHKNRPVSCLMTMLTFRTDKPTTCGIVELNSENVVTGFHEKKLNPPGNLANAAIYILSIDFLTELKHNLHNIKDFSTELINKYLGKIYSFETKDIFIDIGTPENYLKANQYFDK
jgi:mannose-1-phosphate guanylyltransferase